MGRRGHLRREWDPSRGRGLVGIRLSWLLSASLQPAQVAGAPGAVIRVAVPELEAWRSGMGSEGIQDSSGYLPEVLTVVADTAGIACPPGIQPCQSDQPRVQLVAHSWAETTPVGSQHLWAPRASGPENGTCVSGIAMRTAPPYTHTPYNPAITRAQIHQFSGTTSKQQQHVLHLPHTRPNIGYLPKKRNGAGRARVH